MMHTTSQRPTLVFDADDTLWDCQGHFERVMHQLYEELLPWAGSTEAAANELFATERKNMPLLGFGVKAFTLSILETAMRVSHNQMPMATLQRLLEQCYTLLELPCTPLPHVRQTLWALQQRGLNMVLFTKGELLDQQHKIDRSGLAGFFSHVEITSDKREADFRQLARKLGAQPRSLTMVGNSMRSDIIPAIAAGWNAIHIPFHITWELETAETFEHPRLTCLDSFAELAGLQFSN